MDSHDWLSWFETVILCWAVFARRKSPGSLPHKYVEFRRSPNMSEFPPNSWQSYKNMFVNVDEFLESIDCAASQNALSDLVHRMVWHKRQDPVRWVMENKELALRICAYSWYSDVPEEITSSVERSLK